MSKTHTDTLLELEPKTLSIKLGDVMTEALIDALADTVAAVKAKSLYNSLNNIKAETLVEALNQTIAKHESVKHQATHCPMSRLRHRPICRLTD